MDINNINSHNDLLRYIRNNNTEENLSIETYDNYVVITKRVKKEKESLTIVTIKGGSIGQRLVKRILRLLVDDFDNGDYSG